MSELIAHGRHYEVAMRAPGTRSPHTTASVSDPHRTRLRCLKHASQCASQAQPWCMLQWRLRPTGPGTNTHVQKLAWRRGVHRAVMRRPTMRCGAAPGRATRCGAVRGGRAWLWITVRPAAHGAAAHMAALGAAALSAAALGAALGALLVRRGAALGP